MEAISVNATVIKQKISHKNLVALLNYQTLFILFLFGSVAGFFLEGVWHTLKTGTWESHSAVVWGPFCIIYGVGLLVVYVLTYFLSGYSTPKQFVLFSFSGTVIKYFSSLIQEVWFGSKSWDYSDHFLNIEGRISLQMSLIWGALGLLFVWFLRPMLQSFLDIAHGKWLNCICIILSFFMVVNLLVTSVALNRWKNRQNGEAAMTAIELAVDRWFDNTTMTNRFPNMTFTKDFEDTGTRSR